MISSIAVTIVVIMIVVVCLGGATGSLPTAVFVVAPVLPRWSFTFPPQHFFVSLFTGNRHGRI